MRAIICDDNRGFAEKLSKQIVNYYRNKEIEIEILVCQTAQEVLDTENLRSYDVAFLDVEMKPINGIELGRRLAAQNASMILVYISALLEFSLQGYKVRAFRYLLKKDLKTDFPSCLDEVFQEYLSTNHFFEFKKHNDIIRIPYKDIYYFESDRRKINIYGIAPGTPIDYFNYHFADLVEDLRLQPFLQTGRSNLVNMRYIQRLSAYTVLLTNGIEKSVSRKDYAEIKRRFVAWKGDL